MAQELQEKLDLKKFKEIANITPVVLETKPITDTHKLYENFSLSNWKCIPNLLSEKYKLR